MFAGRNDLLAPLCDMSPGLGAPSFRNDGFAQAASLGAPTCAPPAASNASAASSDSAAPPGRIIAEAAAAPESRQGFATSWRARRRMLYSCQAV